MGSNIVFPPYSTSNCGFSRYETLLTVDEMRKRFLHGVNFLDDDGNDFEPSVFQFALSAAISEFEHKLNMAITPTEFVDYIDYDFNDYNNFGYLNLKHKPVLSVASVQLQLIQGKTLIDFPPEWIRLYSESGQIQITPTSGTVSGFMIGNSGFLPTVYGVTRNFPQMIKVTYTAGFEQDKIPNVINNIIGLNASIPLLITAGELIIGAGIASESIGLDGLSKSVTSTASAMYNGYSARILEYRNILKVQEPLVMKYYNGINFRVS